MKNHIKKTYTDMLNNIFKHEKKIKNNVFDEYAENIKCLNKINYDELQSIYDEKLPIYVYIGRPTCKYCRAMAPVIKELNNKLKGNLYYYDTDEKDFNESGRNFVYNIIGIEGIPSIIKLQNKQIVSSWLGDGINAEDLYKHLCVTK